MIGKKIRIERVMDRNTKKTVMIPLIHAVGMGPIEGTKDIKKSVDIMALGGANAVILHKGIVRAAHRRSGEDIGLVIHLTATAEDGKQTLVTDVEEAVAMGADAISVRIEIGAGDETDMLRLLGRVARNASRWGMPLFALMHPIHKEDKDKERELRNLMRAARIGAEMGADVVRVPYSGSPETFREVVSVCPVPLVAIGGEKKAKEEDFLEMVSCVMQAGASGVSAGRNVFQYRKPGNMIKAIGDIVHKGLPVSAAMDALKEKPIESAIFSINTPIW